MGRPVHRRPAIPRQRQDQRQLSHSLPRALHRDFVNKLGMVVEESDESVFWLMFVGRSGMSETVDQKDLLAEARELLAIFVKSAKTASGQ